MDANCSTTQFERALMQALSDQVIAGEVERCNIRIVAQAAVCELRYNKVVMGVRE